MPKSHDKWGTLSYEKAMDILGNRSEKLLCGDKRKGWTRLVMTDEGPAVRLWNTNIITFRKDGSVVLRTGGWNTVTTGNRLARYCPYMIRTWNRRWTVWHLGRHYEFEDGMVITDTTCSTDPVELELFEDLTGIKVPTIQKMKEAIIALDVKALLKIFKKYVFQNDVIALTPVTNLPLLMGRVPEEYKDMLETRLARGY